MQMRVERLRETLKLLQSVVPKKSKLPILSNVLLEDGKAIATDLDLAVALDLPEAEGKCLIPHRQVLELLKYVPGNEMVTIEASKQGLLITWEEGQASYAAIDPEEYPAGPHIKKPEATGSINGDRFVPALTSAVQYCSTDNARPVLTGVSLSFGETIEVAAGDGFRMAYFILPLAFPAEVKVIVPAPFVEVFGGLWSKLPPGAPLADSLVGQVMSQRMVEITIGEGVLVASFGKVRISSQLIVGTAPNFSQLVPKEPPLKVRLFAPDLERAVHRLKQIAKESSGIVRFTWDETSMAVGAESGGTGSIEARIPVQAEGGPGKVAVNVAYLLDYLKGKEGLISMETTDRSSPVLFRNGATSPLVVVMPMHADWPGEPPTEAPKTEQTAEPSTKSPEGEPPDEGGEDEPPDGGGGNEPPADEPAPPKASSRKPRTAKKTAAAK